MATAYTSILKLALPVQGELSGTWGDVVNDNITSMVEEAIAGRAVINTWTTNSHTLTSADGTTSESRCAMLEFTDTGTALTGDATVVCPTQSKIYICKNDAGQKVTIKTSAGTGVAIADGQTMFVFCDGTNVVEAVTSMSSLKLGTAATSVQVTAILDEDNMASDSATSLATQQSIKAYVDSQVTAQDLDFAGDTGTGAVDLDSQSLTIAGTTNEIETSAADQTLTIGLPDAVTVTTSVTTPTVQATNVKANDGTAAVTIADSTGQTTIADAVLTTADINGGTIDGTTIGATTATTGAFTTVTSSGNTTVSGSLVTDTISEETATAGVTVDGLLVKDTGIGVADASGTDVAGSDVTVRGGAGTGTGAGGELLFKVAPAGTTGTSVNALATGMKLDSTKALYVDTINELTSAAGVTIDSVLLKDDVVNASDIETSTISANDGTTAINIADSTGAVDIDTSLNVDGAITGDGLTIETSTGVVLTGTGTGAPHTATRGTAALGASRSVFTFGANSTGDVTDGFGPALQFNISDTGVSNEEIGAIGFIRDGGDSIGKFVVANGANNLNSGTNQFFATGPTEGTVFNEGGASAYDFRVESNSYDHMLFVDSSEDAVGINISAPKAPLHIAAKVLTTGTAPQYRLNPNGDDATDSDRAIFGLATADTQFFPTALSGDACLRSPTDNKLLLGTGLTERVRISNNGTVAIGTTSDQYNHASNEGIYLDPGSSSSMSCNSPVLRLNRNGTGGNNRSNLEFYNNGTVRGYIGTHGAEDGIYFYSGTDINAIDIFDDEVVINNGDADLDFRVESLNNTNMFIVDAAEDTVKVNTTADSGHEFQVGGSISFQPGGAAFQATNARPTLKREADGELRVAAGSDSSSQITFYTSPSSGGTLTERVTIEKTGELNLADNSAFNTDSTATSATTQTAVYSFSSTTYTGAKLIVCVTDSTATERYITELLVTHDGTTAVATEYGQVATDTALATFDVDISGGNVRLLATPASSNSMTFKVMSTQLLA